MRHLPLSGRQRELDRCQSTRASVDERHAGDLRQLDRERMPRSGRRRGRRAAARPSRRARGRGGRARSRRRSRGRARRPPRARSRRRRSRRRAAGGGRRRRRWSSRAPPWRRGAAGRRAAAARRSSGSSVISTTLLVVEVDLGGSERAGDERARQTVADQLGDDVGRPLHRGGGGSSPARARRDRRRRTSRRRRSGRRSPSTRARRDVRDRLAGDDPGALGAERQDDLGTPSARSASLSRLPARMRASSSFTLRTVEVREDLPVDVVVALERPDRRPPEAPLGVEQQLPAAVAERRDRRVGKCERRRPATCTQAASASGAAAQPSTSSGRPRVADRVDRPSRGGRPRSGS